MMSRFTWSAVPVMLVLAGCGQPPEPEPEAPRLTTVSVSCTPAALTAGQSTQCSASALDQFGAPFSVSTFSWSSGDEAIARVDSSSGKVATAVLSSGSVAIRAQAAGSTTQGEAALTVAPKPPTVHSTPVTSAETWKALDNPHLVTGSISVDAAVALTLEPGAVIRFAPDAELKVARGSLQAAGTAQAPVLLQAEKGGKGAWKGVVLAAKDTASSLEFVTLSGCGGAQGAGACLVIRDGAAPVLKNVKVKDSGSLGVLVATADSGFGAGSARLSVFDSTGAAVRLDANQAGTLPVGDTFYGNRPDAVELTGTAVTRTQTWPNLGVVQFDGAIPVLKDVTVKDRGSPQVLPSPRIPYVVKQSIIVGHPTTLATLTVSAGTKVRFSADTYLVGGSFEDSVGGLVLEGTAADPILLTADSDNPQPGFWRGLHVFTDSPNAGRISHTTIEFAGKLPLDTEPFPVAGGLILYAERFGRAPSEFVVTDLVVRKSGGPGIDMTNGGEFGPGSARLRSRENATYPILLQPNSVSRLPRDFDFRDNGNNVLALSSGIIIETQTWPKLGLPYLLTGNLYVGYTNTPTLTLAAGTEIRAAKDSGLFVGFMADYHGKLIAQGTAAAPVQFIPDSATAPAGYWLGLYFDKAAGSKLDYTVVSHGGQINSKRPDLYGASNVNIYTDIGQFMTHSTLKKSYGCAYFVDGDIKTDLGDASLHNNLTDNPDTRCVR